MRRIAIPVLAAALLASGAAFAGERHTSGRTVGQVVPDSNTSSGLSDTGGTVPAATQRQGLAPDPEASLLKADAPDGGGLANDYDGRAVGRTIDQPSDGMRRDQQQKTVAADEQACSTLRWQWEQAYADHLKSGGDAKSALHMATRGDKLCAQGIDDRGAGQLRAALQKIGQSPKA